MIYSCHHAHTISKLLIIISYLGYRLLTRSCMKQTLKVQDKVWLSKSLFKLYCSGVVVAQDKKYCFHKLDHCDVSFYK